MTYNQVKGSYGQISSINKKYWKEKLPFKTAVFKKIALDNAVTFIGFE